MSAVKYTADTMSLLQALATETSCKVALTYHPTNRGIDDDICWSASVVGFYSAAGASPEEALTALRSLLKYEGWLQ